MGANTARGCILVCMKQLNLNVTPDFERDLRSYMRLKSIPNKSDAIRQALREAVARDGNHKEYDYRKWLGLGLKAPLSRRRKFKSEDELWS